MKRLVAGVIGGFALLSGVTIYIAHRSYDGLVDRRYYEAASSEFSGREEEERAGFTATLTDRYIAGKNRFRASLSTSAGPLRGARVTLDALRIEGPRYDRTVTLVEEAPGVYAADLFLPVPGQWTFSLLAEADRLRARRRWTGVARAEDPPGTLRGAAGSQEVRLSISPWPPRTMREVEFVVSLPGFTGTFTPYLDLRMAEMEMGRNHVDLAPGSDGRYRGTGVIVRCASGRKDWEATVTVPGSGKAVFRFDVAD